VNSHEPNRLSLVPLRLTPLADGHRPVARAVGFTAVPSSKPVSVRQPVAGSARSASAREPLWRDVVGDVLRRERLAQARTLKDVADTARISMPYLSELERGRKEASSEVLAAAARALGLGLADLLGLAQAELARLNGEGDAVPARVPVPLSGPAGGPGAAPLAGSAKDGAGAKPVRLEPPAAAVPALAPAIADHGSGAGPDRAGRGAEAVATAVSEVHLSVRAAGTPTLLAAWRGTMSLVA
jgi:hypothetical protein